MDPLSITSGVLAELGGIAAAAKALKKLHSSAAYFQDEISQIINEVIMYRSTV